MGAFYTATRQFYTGNRTVNKEVAFIACLQVKAFLPHRTKALPYGPDSRPGHAERNVAALHITRKDNGETHKHLARMPFEKGLLTHLPGVSAEQQLLQVYHLMFFISSSTLPWRSITMPTVRVPKGRGSGVPMMLVALAARS